MNEEMKVCASNTSAEKATDELLNHLGDIKQHAVNINMRLCAVNERLFGIITQDAADITENLPANGTIGLINYDLDRISEILRSIDDQSERLERFV